MALEAENSIPIIFVDPKKLQFLPNNFCRPNNLQFQFVWKSTKCGRREGGEYIYICVLGCLGVVGLEKEISGIIEFGALNEWKKIRTRDPQRIWVCVLYSYEIEELMTNWFVRKVPTEFCLYEMKSVNNDDFIGGGRNWGSRKKNNGEKRELRVGPDRIHNNLLTQRRSTYSGKKLGPAPCCFVVLESLALVVTFYVLLFQLCVLLLQQFCCCCCNFVVVVIGFLFLGVWYGHCIHWFIIIHDDITAHNRRVGF